MSLRFLLIVLLAAALAGLIVFFSSPDNSPPLAEAQAENAAQPEKTEKTEKTEKATPPAPTAPAAQPKITNPIVKKSLPLVRPLASAAVAQPARPPAPLTICADPAQPLEQRLQALQTLAERGRIDAHVEALVVVLSQAEEPDLLRHEIINLLRRDAHPDLDQILQQQAQTPTNSDRMRSYAVQHLRGSLAEPAVRESLWRLLREDPALTVRREAFLTLLEQPDAELLAALDQPHDALWHGLHDLLLAAWKDRRDDSKEAAVAEFLHSREPQVLVQAINVAGSLGFAALRPQIEVHRHSGPSAIRQVAQLALDRLSAAP